MSNLQIVDIELSMTEQDFRNALQDEIDNYHENMSYDMKLLRTKYGNTMHKIQIINDDGSYATIVGEQDAVTGNIHFHPIKLSNFHDSFYEVVLSNQDIAGQDNDPGMFLAHAFRRICRQHNGSFGYIDPNGGKALMRNGKEKTGLALALVDKDGNVYSSYGAKSVSVATEGLNFSVKKPIAEWLQENREVAVAIQQLPLDAKMNYIGKYLIQARTNDEIDADEFTDIFCQAGLIGFTDNTVLGIYKLLM